MAVLLWLATPLWWADEEAMCDEPLGIRWPFPGPLDWAGGGWRTGTPAFFTGRCEMDEEDAVEEGLDLSLFAVRSLVTTADLGCGMKEPVCGEPDRELLQLVEVLGAAMPEGPVGLLICLLCTTAAMFSYFAHHSRYTNTRITVQPTKHGDRRVRKGAN